MTLQSSGWMLLRADRLRLLLPIAEVAAIERLDATPRPGQQPGLYEIPGDESTDGALLRVAALSNHVQRLAEMPADRFIVTLLAQRPDLLLAWDEARLLSSSVVQLQELPAVMCAPKSPLLRFAEINGEVAFATSAKHLLDYAFADAPAEAD